MSQQVGVIHHSRSRVRVEFDLNHCVWVIWWNKKVRLHMNNRYFQRFCFRWAIGFRFLCLILILFYPLFPQRCLVKSKKCFRKHWTRSGSKSHRAVYKTEDKVPCPSVIKNALCKCKAPKISVTVKGSVPSAQYSSLSHKNRSGYFG